MARPRNFVNVNNHKWAYLRKGKGRPLVIFHGFMCYADYFNSFMDSLSDTFDVIVPDLPGFGFTPRLKQNTYENIAQGAKDFIRQLNLNEVSIFGVSLGGAIALEYAIDFPDKTKIVILNSPFWGKDSLSKGIVENVEIDLLKLPNSILNILKTKLIFKELANFVLSFHPSAKRIFRTHEKETLEAASLMDIEGNRELLYSLMQTNFTKKLENYKNKTLLISGLKDEVVTPRAVEDLKKVIGGDLVEVKRQTHEFVIKSPDKLIKIIRDYLLNGKRSKDKDFVWE